VEKRILVFVNGTKTGGGSGFVNLVEATLKGTLDAKIVGVVSTHYNGGVQQKADRLTVPFRLFTGPWEAEEYQIFVDEFQPHLICLSGWLRPVVGLDPKITINIHPGPLPQFGGQGFYGHHVHEAVMAAYSRGEITHTAVTMHFVTEKYDDGPIIFVKRIKILDNDTPESLAQRVNVAEHTYQPIITQMVVTGGISWDGKDKRSLSVPPWCLDG